MRKGFTVIEAMVIIGIIAVLGLIVFQGFTSCRDSRDKATDEANKFLAELGIKAHGVSCAQRDSDNDGYVSCTASVEEGGKMKMMPIECASNWSWNDGCRLPKFQIR